MAKKESTFLNMLMTLFIVTLGASIALAIVHEVTEEPIAQAAFNRKAAAIQEVVPEFDNNPIDEQYQIPLEAGALNCFPGKRNGKLVGTAIESFTKIGFNGEMRVMVGLYPNGKIFDTRIIEHDETPGLGDKVDQKKSDFAKQFKDKNPKSFKLLVKKDGGNIDAVTAATISSRAYCEAVERAYTSYKKGKK